MLPTTNITLISWNMLWVYWPMYIALIETEKNSNPKVKFTIDAPDEITDLAIKALFFERINRKPDEIIMALSEPTSLQEEKDRLPDNFIIRKIPLLWRQPHWFLMDRQSDFVEKGLQINPRNDVGLVNMLDVPLKSLPEKLNIYCLPSETTSGDFVRTLCLRFPELTRSLNSFHDEEEFGSKFISDKVKSKSSDDKIIADDDLREAAKNCCITYTPRHLTDPGRIVALQEFVGPEQNITALLIPQEEGQNGNTGNQVTAIYNDILINLQETLSTLNNTQGNAELIGKYIESYHERIEQLLPSSAFPDEYTTENISKCLSAYIQRGCYFPFKVAGDTLLEEVSFLVRRQVEKIKRDIQNNVHGEMSHLFGAGKMWSGTSFKERTQVLTNWRPGQGNDKRNLVTYLSHLQLKRINAELGYSNLIKAIEVKLNDNSPWLSLVNFKEREQKLFCNTSISENQTIFGDCMKLKLQVNSENMSDISSSCFACQICGVPGAILKSGSKLLVGKLHSKMSTLFDASHKALFKLIDCYSLDLNDPDKNFYTLMCWEDVQEMFKTFNEEMRTPDLQSSFPPIAIVISNDWQADKGGRTLITIFWRGDTKKGTGITGGNAKLNLQKWTRKNQGTKPESVALWWFDKSEFENGEIWKPIFTSLDTKTEQQSDAGTVSSDINYIGQLDVWKKAREVVREGDYNFAYVAVFNCPKFSEKDL